ncbi:MAG: Rieske (2Fe-2S) protein [Deltaproteobacteria bacterium]|nr:Rieske (2Fe-2S) protein [Deltaproteobacteria bacterium]
MKEKPKSVEQEGPGPFGTVYVPPGRRAKITPENTVCAGKISEIPLGSAKSILLDKFNISLFHIGGGFYAVKEACPHAQYPLTKGKVVGETVTCASHNWKFNVRTGECLRGEEGLTIKTFPVEIRDGEVWIKL